MLCITLEHHSWELEVEVILSVIVSFIMAVLWNRAGHYIFCPVFSFFFSSFFVSSPNFSGRRLSVYHISTHGVTLMQVWNVLHAASRKCETQIIAKNSTSGHHCTTLSGYIFATKAHIDSRKKLVKQQYLPHMSLQYGGLQPTSG